MTPGGLFTKHLKPMNPLKLASAGDFTIRPLQAQDLDALRRFTDHAIGTGYYSAQEVQDIWQRSQTAKGEVLTLVLENSQGLCGVRITYPPGRWKKGKGRGLTIEKWPHALSQTAYFQSLFVAPQLTGQGWGRKLSLAALKLLVEIGAEGVVCHSWKESPHDSSGKYLRGLGFQLIQTHPLYWKEVDYQCTRCGKPCLCTAEEMYLDLADGSKNQNEQMKGIS